MGNEAKILKVLRDINGISSDETLNFNQKSQKILNHILSFLNCRSGSIMIMKGRNKLEVIASDNEGLRGMIQPLNENTPSSWVIKNKKVLNVADISQYQEFQKRFDHYKRDAFLIAPVINDGKVIGIINITDKKGDGCFSKEEQDILLDITCQMIGTLEIQRLLEQLKAKRKTLQKKNRDLGRMERMKDDLYNMLVHDLKGPIAEMISNMDILSYVIGEEHMEYLDSARLGCNNLNDMVSNLLDITRLEDGRMRLIHERIVPGELLKETMMRLSGLLTLKSLDIREKYPEKGTVDFFWGDRGILLRVFQNLVTNAINHSPEGETIEAGYEEDNESNEIRFFIKDRGVGVPLEHRDAIFDKFFNLGEGNGKTIYSTGLGLTFCKMAIKAHGGDIGVEDSHPRGSCFHFRLPVSNGNLL